MQSESSQVEPVSKTTLWTGRVVSALPVLMLLFSAIGKFAKPTAVVEGFAELGWPDNLTLALGIVELGCVIIYLIPRTAVLGAILLTGYLGGATAAHVRLHDNSFVMPIILGILIWLGLYLRDRRLRDLVPLRR
jgi:hypothetical protein